MLSDASTGHKSVLPARPLRQQRSFRKGSGNEATLPVGIMTSRAKGGDICHHGRGPCQHVGHTTRLLQMLQGMHYHHPRLVSI